MQKNNTEEQDKLPIFIDIEASGWPNDLNDGGYAIEIAWNDDRKENIQHFLINPYSLNSSFDFWSFEAQKIHNISREMLREQGVDPLWLVEYLNDQLKDKILFSDAPIYDDHWINRIYKACNIEKSWKINSVNEIWYKLFGSSYPNDISHMTKQLEKEGIKHTHRAADDVKQMLQIYLRAIK